MAQQKKTKGANKDGVISIQRIHLAMILVQVGIERAVIMYGVCSSLGLVGYHDSAAWMMEFDIFLKFTCATVVYRFTLLKDC